MLRALAVFASVAAASLIAFALLRGADAPTPGGSGEASGEATSRRLDELAQRLDDEASARGRLEEEVQALKARLAALSAASAPEIRADGGPPASAERPSPGDAPLDPELLARAGFPRRDVEAFAARVDEIELRRLYLRDRARREGWLGTPRFAAESRALRDEIDATRAEFGDEFYDWSLFATGRPNRIRVAGVMDGSPALDAGIQEGDLVVRYAEIRLFGASELNELTGEGTAGTPTPVELVRNGETLRVFLPRGPLGIRVEPASEEPAPAR